MEIVEYSPSLLPELTQLINQHICSIPPGWTLSEAQVVSVLTDAEPFWTLHYPEDEPSPTYIICVLDGGHLAAACQWECWSPPNDAGLKSATLIWIASHPRNADAVDALLGAIIHEANALDCSRIMTSRFGYGVGWLGVATEWTHLAEGFLRAGFAVSDKWIIMTASINQPLQQPRPNSDSVTLNWDVNESSLEWNVEAYVDGALAGECQAWAIPTYFEGCKDFSAWVTVEWLGVEEPYQRRGIGRLLMQEQMSFHAQRGVKNVIVWTETDNIAAQKFNETLGFTYGPQCWSFTIALEGG